MGYCVTWEKVKLTVSDKRAKVCLEAINELMKPANVKKYGRGGEWNGGKQTGWWYSWVENPPDNKYKTLKEAFTAWGFDCEAVSRSTGHIVTHCNNEKLGQEELFLKTIAPFLKADSIVEVTGEDGAHWRWVFKKKALVTQVGKVIYENA